MLPAARLLPLVIVACLGLALPGPACAVDLPQTAPIPDKEPVGGSEQPVTPSSGRDSSGEQALPEEAPVPATRPGDAAGQEQESLEESEPGRSDAGDTEAGTGKDGEAAAPQEGRGAEPDKKGAEGEEGIADDDEEPAPPPPDFAPLSEKGRKCRADLKTMGVKFSERDPVSTGDGCLMPHPIAITTLAEGVTIEPEAELNCATAERVARFVEEVVQPAAFRHFGQGVKALQHASAYVCRPRAGTHTISEHAYGNALDIAAFVLEDGTSIGVKAYDRDDQEQLDAATFLDEIRAAACGPFTTVLGPGSNAAHATHFHLDIKKRGGGYKVCE